MSFKIALYIDVDAGGGAECLLDGLSSSPASNPPVFCQGDAIPLQLYFREKANSAMNDSTSIALPENSVLILAAKKKGSLDVAGYLFSVTDFIKQTVDSEIYYSSTLLLNNAAITTLFEGLSTNFAEIVIDIEVQNADNTERITFQFAATLKQEVYNTTDVISSPVVADYRIRSGKIQWYDPVSDLWYPLTLQNQNGVLMFAPGPGVPT